MDHETDTNAPNREPTFLIASPAGTCARGTGVSCSDLTKPQSESAPATRGREAGEPERHNRARRGHRGHDVVQDVRACARGVVHEVQHLAWVADPAHEHRLEGRPHGRAVDSAAVVEIVPAGHLAEVIEADGRHAQAAAGQALDRLAETTGITDPTVAGAEGRAVDDQRNTAGDRDLGHPAADGCRRRNGSDRKALEALAPRGCEAHAEHGRFVRTSIGEDVTGSSHARHTRQNAHRGAAQHDSIARHVSILSSDTGCLTPS